MKRIEIRDSLTLVFIFVIVLISTLFNFTPIYADDTNLGRTPDGVFPLQENDVIMESEEIIVDLEKNNVECIFVFHNTGNSKNVYMGFPGQLDDSDHENTNVVDLEIRNFKTFINGKKLPVTREKSIEKDDLENLNMQDYSEFFTFTVPFQANETITVRNTYDFMPTYDSIGNVYSGYVLETGSMWKGRIGSAKVTFKLGNIKPYQLEKLNPGGFRFEGNTLVWERNDFEPKYNLSVTYNTYRYSPDFYLNSDETLKREVYLKKNGYDIAKQLASKNDTEGLITLYNKAIKEYNSILALYIASFLPADKIVKESTKIDSMEIQKMYDYYIAKCNIIGQEPVNTQIRVSHLENGNVVEDDLGGGTTSYGLRDLTPGIEYDITYTLTDWMDRTEQKTIKFKVPEQDSDGNGDTSSNTSVTASVTASATASGSSEINVSDENNTQSYETFAVASASGSPEVDIQSDGLANLNNSANENDVSNNATTNVSNSSNKLETVTQNGIDLRIIVGVVISVILLGVAVATILIMRKKEQD